ncbi:hypothetical protein ACFWN2_35015 [Lentzea sp. NPDC058436]|uniref:hypothetical protein n=1 Tax=Lentzea sp. NPDC058436 TaxID=3346499 RepID=UPI0036614A88
MGAAVLATIAVAAPAAQADTGCVWGMKRLPIPAGQSSYGALAGAGDWLASSGGTSVVIWHHEVARTVEFPVDRATPGINRHGVLISHGEDGVWRGEEKLGELPGGPSTVKSINADGDVVGTSGGVLVVWPAGSTSPVVLEGSDDGRTWWPLGIDDDGNVVATTNFDQGMLGYVWNGLGERSELRPLPGQDRTVPTLVENGRVYGYSQSWSGPGAAPSVEWNLSGEVVRTTDEGPVFDVNAAGDELLAWNSAVRRAHGRVDRWSYPYSMPFPSVLADNGDLYGGAYYEGPSKLFCR